MIKKIDHIVDRVHITVFKYTKSTTVPQCYFPSQESCVLSTAHTYADEEHNDPWQHLHLPLWRSSVSALPVKKKHRRHSSDLSLTSSTLQPIISALIHKSVGQTFAHMPHWFRMNCELDITVAMIKPHCNSWHAVWPFIFKLKSLRWWFSQQESKSVWQPDMFPMTHCWCYISRIAQVSSINILLNHCTVVRHI